MPAGKLLTYADLASFPDDGLQRELIGGELIVSASPNTRHQRLVWRLVVAFDDHLKIHPDGEAFVAPFDVLLSDIDVVEPDIIFVAALRSGIVGDANIQGVPSLVIEVVSDSRYDRVRKRDLYAKAGIAEYWIVDPDADRVEVLLLQDDRYAAPAVLEAGDFLTSALLPELRIDVAALLAR